MLRDDIRGRRDPLELILFMTTLLAEYAEHVADLEVADTDYRTVWRRRRLVFENLVSLSYVVHQNLRDSDPVVREAAQWLTTGSAHLIGRMYIAFGARKLCHGQGYVSWPPEA